MHEHVFEQQQRIPLAIERAFEFFKDARNLERITPSWMSFEVVTPGQIEMCPGTEIEYRLRLRGIPIRWLTVIVEYDPPYSFTDVQARGPYALWHHRHRFEADGDGTLMTDTVRYALPGGPLGRLVEPLLVRPDIRRIFEFRREQITSLLPAR